MAVLGEVGVQTRIIATYAPEAIKQRILPAVCSGDCLLAICMTEPDAGTDVANYKTNVDRVGNRLRLNGVKTLISRAEEAGMFVVFTRIDKKPGREGIGWKIAEMYRHIEAARSILYRACATADPFPDPLLAAAAKVTVNEMALRVTSDAIQVHGGYGFTDEFPVSRFYRGARYGTLGG